MNLDFKILLRLIANYPQKEFTSKELSEWLIKSQSNLTEYIPQLHSNPALGELVLRFRTKLISNDLRRLYAMGFLKRRRVKRLCKTKTGKMGFKGYEYKYSLSSQGRKYIEWMMNGERDFEIENFRDLLFMAAIKNRYPEDKQELAWKIHKIYFGDRKGFKRFSTSKNALLIKIIDSMWEVKQECDKKIKELKEEKKKLYEKIKQQKEGGT